MLINYQLIENIYLVCGKTDMRLGIDGLALIVQDKFELNLYQNATFEVSDKSLLGKAFQYLFNQHQKFDRIFQDGRLELTNNRSERAIKSVVMVRKNSLFADSVDGHHTNGIIMSIIETAKMNVLDVSKYIEYLLTELPNHLDALKNGALEAYLPWNEIVQQICRKDCDVKQTI